MNNTERKVTTILTEAPMKFTSGLIGASLMTNDLYNIDDANNKIVDIIDSASYNARFKAEKFLISEPFPEGYFDLDAKNNLASDFASCIIKEAKKISNKNNVVLAECDYHSIIKGLNELIEYFEEEMIFTGSITDLMTFPPEDEDMKQMFLSHVKKGCSMAIKYAIDNMIIKKEEPKQEQPETTKDQPTPKEQPKQLPPTVEEVNTELTQEEEQPEPITTEQVSAEQASTVYQPVVVEQEQSYEEEVAERKFTLDVVEKNGKVRIICGYDNGTTVEDVKQIPLLFAFPNCWKAYKNNIIEVLNLPEIEDFIYKYDTQLLAIDKASKSTVVIQNDKSKVITFAKSGKSKKMKSTHQKSAFNFNKDRYSETA